MRSTLSFPALAILACSFCAAKFRRYRLYIKLRIPVCTVNHRCLLWLNPCNRYGISSSVGKCWDSFIQNLCIPLNRYI
jgi:hypothetical protein